MALPKLSVPIYDLTIPSTQQTVKYRPFLVKEEKLLLMANEGGDDKETVQTLKTVIQSCIQDEIDLQALKIYDFEYIFLQLRARSVGEISELFYVCQNDLKGKQATKPKLCEAKISVKIDLSEVTVKRPDGHDGHIKLTDTVGIMLSDPSVTILDMYGMDKMRAESAEAVFDVMVDCIDYVYEGEQIYKSKDHTKKEMTDFLEMLTQGQFEDIKTFFETIPSVRETVELNCQKCKNKSQMELIGLQDFFM